MCVECVPEQAAVWDRISQIEYFLFSCVRKVPSIDSTYLCTGFSLNFYAKDTSGYIVGTYNISD